MSALGANVAIIENNRVLLTKREDFDVWCLPGGHLDEGETFAETAIREAREEIGVDVRLTRLVGTYTRPTWSNGLYHVQVFAAVRIGGDLCPQNGEVTAIDFFGMDDLPDAMLVGQRHRALDALNNLTGVVTTERVEWPFPGLSRQQVYALRDQPGLAPAEFYRQHFTALRPEQMVIEVAGR
jgi:ADP-ribose pyrophosphatase YjhB (NUDIX family)